MKSSILHIVILLTFLVSSPSSKADSFDEVEQKILKKYGHNVFVVNAYTKYPQTENEEDTISRYKCQNVGTAFSFDNDGHLITLNSVIKNAVNIKVISYSGEKTKARVLGCDSEGSINVLEIDRYQPLSIPKISTSYDMIPGKAVFLLGIVKGEGLTTNTGVISNIKPRNGTFIIDVEGNPGTSGTPVFDKDAHLLGFIAYQIESTEDDKELKSSSRSCYYVVLPVEYTSAIAGSIINRDRGTCGWFGIYSNFNVNSSGEKGVIIQKVIKDSPAEKCGLKIKDSIIEFNGVPTSTPLQLIEAITSTKSGDTVPIMIRRGTKSLSFSVNLSSYPESN